VTETTYDVIVVGSGNAALCAALSASESGGHVVVLERAPEAWRGGNSYFTAGGFRFSYEGLDDIRSVCRDITDDDTKNIDVGNYTAEDYRSDLMRVTEGMSDSVLSDLLVSRSLPTVRWLADRGMRFALMYGRQAYKIDNVFRFWGGLIVEAIGGGAGLVDREIELAENAGVEFRYNTRALRLLHDDSGRVAGVHVKRPAGVLEIRGKAVVLASGGFEANSEMRARYLGPGWELAKVRGTPFNEGDGIKMALEAGATPYGHWSACHAVAWDLNAPPFGNRRIGDLYQKHSYPLGLIVNILGERFVDEGADLRNYTYAKYGKAIMLQPERAAFQIFDAKTVSLLRDEYRIKEATRAEASTIEELARKLDIDAAGLVRTVSRFNAAVQPGPFDPSRLDGKGTSDISPPKSNWAQPIDTPPYIGYGVTCGITFTFGGLRIDAGSRVLEAGGQPIPGLYAAGELVGGLFYHNYPGGSGLMAGAVFGRIAGASAAALA
jgi:tricarballylate dehydrogenase